MKLLLLQSRPALFGMCLAVLPPVAICLYFGHTAIAFFLITVPSAAILTFYWRWLRPLNEHARRFRHVAGRQVVLYYDPALNCELNRSSILSGCETGLEELATYFGFPIRRPVVVFLFARFQEISRIFGEQYGGLAIPGANTIAVAIDNEVHESIRHELTHLFAAKLNMAAVPLLGEGLATWQQGTFRGKPIEIVARQVLNQRCPDLTRLLAPKVFYCIRHSQAHYLVAGSFTGFLIGRFGWERYRKFYKLANMSLVSAKRFGAAFEKCFGMPLERARTQWHIQSLVMPVLNQRLEQKLRS